MKRLANRIVGGVKWRAESLMERMPEGVRVWAENRRLNKKIRRGETSYDRARLRHTFRESMRILEERFPGESAGDYLEFGVYHGTSISCMHDVRAALGLGTKMRLFGFDSFEGLPPSAAWEDDSVWAPGMYASSMDFTRDNLRRWNVPVDDITLIKGFFDVSLTAATRKEHNIERASILMVDCDLYSSTQSVLEFVTPLIHRAAVFVFDDWDSSDLASKNLGEAKAYREYLAAHPEFTSEELPGLNYKDKAGPRVFLLARR